MIKIGIDASRANSLQRTGTEWYSYNLIREFTKLSNSNEEFFLYCKQSLLPDLSRDLPSNFQEKILNWPPRLLWTQFRLAQEMLSNPPEVLFIPAHTMPLIHPRTVITLHDVGFLRYDEAYSFSEKSYHCWALDYALKKATKIIVPSNFTKEEIIHFRPWADQKKIAVVPHGLDDQKFFPAAPNTIEEVKAKYNLPEKYLFYLGRVETKKNILILLQAFKQVYQTTSELALVLAGKPGYGFNQIAEFIKNNPKLPIKLLGYVPEGDIPILLSGAQSFVFVSNYEGFGLPIIQAMACGTPVISAQQASLPEIIGEAGILVPAQEPTVLARAIINLEQRPELKKHYSELGLAKAKEYSWQKTANLTLEIIRGVI